MILLKNLLLGTFPLTSKNEVQEIIINLVTLTVKTLVNLTHFLPRL